MNNITSRALACFREDRATEFARQIGIRAALIRIGRDDDRRAYIAIDKAINAADDCNAAHAEMMNGRASPCANPFETDGTIYSGEMLDVLRRILGDKAEKAYADAESEMEDASLAQFHGEAFGEE